MSTAIAPAELKPGALVVWQPEPGKGYVSTGVVVRSATSDGLVLVERFRKLVSVPAGDLVVYARSYDEFAGKFNDVVRGIRWSRAATEAQLAELDASVAARAARG